MKVAAVLIGGLGNRMFMWARAKAYAEQHNAELRTTEWVGERIFTLDGYEPKRPDGTEDVTFTDYAQSQKDLIYTRADCRRWFKIRPELEWNLSNFHVRWPHAHFRRGDYASAGYPLISRKAVDAAVAEHMFPGELRKNMRPLGEYISVSDESPEKSNVYTGDLSFLPDFYRLMSAPILFRANSSFSYWAGVLGHGRVFSPIITGLKGGVEHDDVPYVAGNWPRLAELSFVTDLHLSE